MSDRTTSQMDLFSCINNLLKNSSSEISIRRNVLSSLNAYFNNENVNAPDVNMQQALLNSVNKYLKMSSDSALAKGVNDALRLYFDSEIESVPHQDDEIDEFKITDNIDLGKGEREQYINSEVLDNGTPLDRLNASLKSNGWEPLSYNGLEPLSDNMDMQYNSSYQEVVSRFNRIISYLERNYDVSGMNVIDMGEDGKDARVCIAEFQCNGMTWTLWCDDTYCNIDSGHWNDNDEKVNAGMAHDFSGLVKSVREQNKLEPKTDSERTAIDRTQAEIERRNRMFS